MLTSEAVSETGRRILTVPNAISVARLGLLAWFLVALFVQNERILAIVVLAVAGATDFLDGYLARRLGQVSELGKRLDPTIDRLLLIGAIVALVDYGAVPVWLAVVVLVREVIVSGVVVGLGAVGAKRIDVLFIGKAGTFGLMAGFPWLLAGDGSGSAEHVIRIIAWCITIPSLVLSLLAACAYVPLAREAYLNRPSVSTRS
jgi:cardiolipin synthase